ncbi:MAG: hypothetical protein MUE60_08565 [Candidatus Eisenbacteria bacterium]|jgi:hypothetical protein|nr:hypothetical protein [Candidatus Eisenbacteria bacterium]
MILKDFVAETLMQVIAGVHEAQQNAPDRGARINPTYESGTSNAFTREVEFDLALAASKGTIEVLLGGSGPKTTMESSGPVHSRVRFSVPVDFPEHKITR